MSNNLKFLLTIIGGGILGAMSATKKGDEPKPKPVRIDSVYKLHDSLVIKIIIENE